MAELTGLQKFHAAKKKAVAAGFDVKGMKLVQIEALLGGKAKPKAKPKAAPKAKAKAAPKAKAKAAPKKTTKAAAGSTTPRGSWSYDYLMEI